MCITLRNTAFLTGIAVTALGAIGAPRARAGELEAAAGADFARFLVAEDRLADVSLSVIDDKLAMSLAVETWVQIGLAEYALPTIHDPELRAMTKAKLQTYRQLLNTVDYLTEGRARSLLESASNDQRRADAGDSAAGDNTSDTVKTSRPQPREKRSRRGGLRGILRSTATKAVLKVRLQIAEQYADLLRCELALAPPGEFDRCYFGIEVYSQLQWLAMLRVFQEQASTDFAQLLAVATSAAETHVAAGRPMIERLDTSPRLPERPAQIAETVEPAGS